MASFTKEVNPWLAKRPLKTNGHLAKLELYSLVKAATVVNELVNTGQSEFSYLMMHQHLLHGE